MKSKKNYASPEIDIIKLSFENILTTTVNNSIGENVADDGVDVNETDDFPNE